MTEKEHIQKLKAMKADCQRCCGLCCVSLHFAKSEGFPENKRAGLPCTQLTESHRCRIHAKLKQQKMKGCIGYDCFGAGQRVTQDLYDDHAWNDDTVSTKEMFDVFHNVYQLYQIRFFLLEALYINTSVHTQEELQKCLLVNEEICNASPSLIVTYPIDTYRDNVNHLLKAVCKTHCKGSNQNDAHVYLGRVYKGKDLSNHDFSMKLLLAADFTNCIFHGAVFLGADTRDTNFCNADLRQALFLSQGQVNSAKGNAKTKLPEHLHRPVTWE